VFVTDVPGIFDKPPPKPKRARLGVANEEGLPVHTKKKRLSAEDETKKLTLIREVRVDEKTKEETAANDAEDVSWRASRVAEGVTVTDDGGVAFADAATLFTSPATVFTSADVELPTSSAVDVTGGIAGKMREAASVARLGVDVYVSSRLPDGAAAAIRGRVARDALEVVPDENDDENDAARERVTKTTKKKRPWMGTLVRGVESRRR
jgi:hypothetical protein